MYNTKVGEVSMPVRVGNGYYLVKVLNRTKAHGQIRCSHILVRNDSTMTPAQQRAALDKISKALTRLEKGESFDEVAKGMSEDPGSAAKGGDLNWFGVGRMVRDFENAAFALKEVGETSGIIRTEFGYHIIKLTGKKAVDTESDEQVEAIKRSMQYDGRAHQAQTALAQKLKVEYNFTYNKKYGTS
jgi:Parvulin-like peptidyl-prolyl isomerase